MPGGSSQGTGETDDPFRPRPALRPAAAFAAPSALVRCSPSPRPCHRPRGAPGRGAGRARRHARATSSRCRSPSRPSSAAAATPSSAPTSPASSPPISSAPGLFAPLDPATFIEPIIDPDAAPRFADWRAINAQALVTGAVARQADGRLRAEFRLWDVFAGQQMAGQQFFTSPDNWRRVAHIIADAIYERLTGEKGYFDTRVVFVDETGPKDKRVKRLAIMDQDGANVRYLTNGNDLVLTPRFNPSRRRSPTCPTGGDQPQRLPAQHRDRPARAGRRLPRHDLRAALLARRPAGDHEPAAGGQRQHLHAWTSARGATTRLTDDAGDRHLPVLLARRLADRLRIRPRRHRSSSM